MSTPRLAPFYSLVRRESIDSTNEEAKRLAAAGAPAGTLVWADEQVSGRGRRGRGWTSPPGNLYTSLLLRPACTPAIACQMNFVAAVALADAVARLLPGAAVALKWPNDVLVNAAKVSGILLEAAAAADHGIDWLVIGVGVNVAHHPADTPYPATSLHREGAAGATPVAVLETYAERFQSWHETWRGSGFAPVRDRWLASASGIGAPIEVRFDRETLRGRFSGLDETGALMLDMEEGGRRQITAGDLFFPQP
jgi:BirA family biotin operon repressor/biotin-[acetyl-CoA-carboxylase] ligase